jgi:DNA-directed RNA polymerase subunit M/transcription elongation factor TFIIS
MFCLNCNSDMIFITSIEGNYWYCSQCKEIHYINSPLNI